MKPLKIAIGVGGRFHSDHMAVALSQLGHDPELFSSQPAFKFPESVKSQVSSILYPEVIFRVMRKLGQPQLGSDFKMTQFGQRLASRLASEPWDVFIGWSSFSKEALERKVASRQVLMRDSSHITVQMDILAREHEKLGIPFRRDQTAEKRELQEYQLADQIFVLSQFAERSFLSQGVPSEKLKVIRLGVDTSLFHPGPSKSRPQQTPLRVVYFGSLSVRKGIHYFLECSKKFKENEVEFHCVGNVDPDLEDWIPRNPQVRFYPAMPQTQLAKFLREMDVFLFPTLEDGFGQTLVQAMASGLVSIVTPYCGAAELVSSNEGILVESASAAALEDAIAQLLKDPKKVNHLKESSVKKAREIHWGHYQTQLENFFGLGRNPGIA